MDGYISSDQLLKSQPRILYPAKLSFRNEGEMKTFSNKHSSGRWLPVERPHHDWHHRQCPPKTSLFLQYCRLKGTFSPASCLCAPHNPDSELKMGRYDWKGLVTGFYPSVRSCCSKLISSTFGFCNLW